MTSLAARSGRGILWIAVTVMVILALAVTAMRIALPKLNDYRHDITQLIENVTGVPFEIEDVKGYWRNTLPSISLKHLNIKNIASQDVSFGIEEVELEFDLIASLLSLEPQISQLKVKGVSLDISHINYFQSQSANEVDSIEQDHTVIDLIEKLFIRQLKDFDLLDSTVIYRTLSGERRSIDIEQLKWRNRGREHKAEGLVSVIGSNINRLAIKANFVDHGSIRDVSGDFFVQAKNIRIAPWLTSEWLSHTGIKSGQLSFNTWFSLENNQPLDAYVELLPSELIWQKEREHHLLLEEGVFKLNPNNNKDKWSVSGHSLKVISDDLDWPVLDFAAQYDADKWSINVSQLSIAALRSVAPLAMDMSTANEWLERLDPQGLIDDLRLSQKREDKAFTYSATLTQGAIKQWELLPEVHDINATISGNGSMLNAHVTLIDDVLPYGDVFQAPLSIKNGEVNLVWQSDEKGWRLWADKVTAATPDLQVQGAFKLDFPHDSSPFLSFYAETDLYNAGETWRYLPTRALGLGLTNYLSTAIQGGNADNARIIWYGPINRFPYLDHSGIFQASVDLNETKFSFDTKWPSITDMQLALLFENASLYMDSDSATLLKVNAEKIVGQIKHLGPSGEVEIAARAKGNGRAVRDYMMATPLVNSVGAALTAVRVNGEVTSEFQLNIPFDGNREARAWGYADLEKSKIKIATPAMELEKAKGRITFDNDVVRASGLSAHLMEQPISIDFKGENLNASYSVGVDIVGDWEIAPLAPYLGNKWTKRVQGHAPWNMDIDIQLKDTGFTYQIDTQANLDYVSSQYPRPLTKALGEKSRFSMQASGNQESVSARVQLPNVKYQAEIDISGRTPVLDATNLLVGTGGFKVSPVVGHDITIRTPSFNLDDWLAIVNEPYDQATPSHISTMNTPTIPAPQRVSMVADTVTFATIEWNDVNIQARKKSLSWLIDMKSSELKGQANYLEPYDLTVALDRLHLYIPALDESEPEERISKAEALSPLITEIERTVHNQMPNLTLNIKDFWLQGYKVGTVNIDLHRTGERIDLKNIDINSGSNQFKAQGWWLLTEQQNKTGISMLMVGENNSELMDRFGISSGIQKAPFEVSTVLTWDGSPWTMQTKTLNGKLDAKFGKGIISDVSGAAKLLGMFSLDSIIRKMQLDFTGVFDNGMAFSSITGSGEVDEGIFVTKDIKMDATAGDMLIQGMANLNTNTVDAQVEFTPDLTSGIPVLTAFAVAPQTAIVVFAISTVISPVVDVFTKVRYQVVGPLDSPEVKEISRSKGAYELPNPKNRVEK